LGEGRYFIEAEKILEGCVGQGKRPSDPRRDSLLAKSKKKAPLTEWQRSSISAFPILLNLSHGCLLGQAKAPHERLDNRSSSAYIIPKFDYEDGNIFFSCSPVVLFARYHDAQRPDGLDSCCGAI
jgi:hypothetical protein